MFETDFMHTAATVSAPALLTNASALLLGGSYHRHQLAIAAREHDDRHNAAGRRDASVSRRIALSGGAVHAFHFALMAFGIDCALLLTMTVMAPLVDVLHSVLDILGTTLSFIGLAGLLLGILLMATEGLYGLPSDGAYL